MDVESEPPLKRARSGISASRAALQSALDTTDPLKTAEAARVVVECNAELAAALKELAAFQGEAAAAEELQAQVQAQKEAVRRRIGELSAAERRLLELELEASGEVSYLAPEGAPLICSSAQLRPVPLRRLVAFAQQIAYSTAGPPLAPAGPVSLMPLAGTMRSSTLYAPVPRLADPAVDATLRPPPARMTQPAAPQQPPPSHASRPMPPELNLDLDLEQSDSSSADSSESSAASDEEEAEANSW
jgi:hypothetical protein